MKISKRKTQYYTQILKKNYSLKIKIIKKQKYYMKMNQKKVWKKKLNKIILKKNIIYYLRKIKKKMKKLFCLTKN